MVGHVVVQSLEKRRVRSSTIPSFCLFSNFLQSEEERNQNQNMESSKEEGNFPYQEWNAPHPKNQLHCQSSAKKCADFESELGIVSWGQNFIKTTCMWLIAVFKKAS